MKGISKGSFNSFINYREMKGEYTNVMMKVSVDRRAFMNTQKFVYSNQ